MIRGGSASSSRPAIISRLCGCNIVIFDRGDDYRIDRGNDARLPPRWVSRFISEVDGQDENEITASRALEILAECAA